MSKVILIVDDEKQVRKLVRCQLETSGYTIIEAANGMRGIELAETGKPDLILMDILMPGMDGYVAGHFIKTNSKTRDIPMVMLTAVDIEVSKDIAEHIGADGYVTKPFTREKLLEAIGQFLPTS